nr:MAG TPA: hypothetical protein [Caudoviricetes sp.]
MNNLCCSATIFLTKNFYIIIIWNIFAKETSK